ncbi:hypothetical protein MNBD_NITROSPINAE02-1485 [hydrothermal vent metagenome]|uniref:Aminoglycoside phosphotransferase domain-containing protein n=1 Tax=hydrothermal vent metagenome TaxID=652676 RepID=A0A3B1CSZ9_9ZZZZ
MTSSSLLKDALSNVFPAGTEFTWNPAEVEPDERYLVIPNNRGPRWIIPKSPRLGLLALTQWNPYFISQRVMWLALIAAYRTNMLGFLPKIISFGASGATRLGWGHLGWSESHAPIPVVIVRTEFDHKAVATLVDPATQKPRIVAKIPIEGNSARMILNEADTLTQLAEETPGLAPRLIFLDREQSISAQEFVYGRSSNHKLDREHFRLATKLAREGRHIKLSDLVEGLVSRLNRIDNVDRNSKKLLEKILPKIADQTRIPAVRIHGDFVPWNMHSTKDGGYVILDWEDSVPEGPPFYDLFHFLFKQAAISNAKADICDKLAGYYFKSDYSKHLGISEAIFSKLLLYYLASRLIKNLDVNGSRSRVIFYTKEILSLL